MYGETFPLNTIIIYYNTALTLKFAFLLLSVANRVKTIIVVEHLRFCFPFLREKAE
jgi:hypothetical protein